MRNNYLATEMRLMGDRRRSTTKQVTTNRLLQREFFCQMMAVLLGLKKVQIIVSGINGPWLFDGGFQLGQLLVVCHDVTRDVSHQTSQLILTAGGAAQIYIFSRGKQDAPPPPPPGLGEERDDLRLRGLPGEPGDRLVGSRGRVVVIMRLCRVFFC